MRPRERALLWLLRLPHTQQREPEPRPCSPRPACGTWGPTELSSRRRRNGVPAAPTTGRGAWSACTSMAPTAGGCLSVFVQPCVPRTRAGPGAAWAEWSARRRCHVRVLSGLPAHAAAHTARDFSRRVRSPGSRRVTGGVGRRVPSWGLSGRTQVPFPQVAGRARPPVAVGPGSPQAAEAPPSGGSGPLCPPLSPAEAGPAHACGISPALGRTPLPLVRAHGARQGDQSDRGHLLSSPPCTSVRPAGSPLHVRRPPTPRSRDAGPGGAGGAATLPGADLGL